LHAAELPGGPYYVGEFFALERAGRAAQFFWYAVWDVQTEFTILGTSGTMVATSSRYAGYDSFVGILDPQYLASPPPNAELDIDDWPPG
jgi:hypothetical protein